MNERREGTAAGLTAAVTFPSATAILAACVTGAGQMPGPCGWHLRLPGRGRWDLFVTRPLTADVLPHGAFEGAFGCCIPHRVPDAEAARQPSDGCYAPVGWSGPCTSPGTRGSPARLDGRPLTLAAQLAPWPGNLGRRLTCHTPALLLRNVAASGRWRVVLVASVVGRPWRWTTLDRDHAPTLVPRSPSRSTWGRLGRTSPQWAWIGSGAVRQHPAAALWHGARFRSSRG